MRSARKLSARTGDFVIGLEGFDPMQALLDVRDAISASSDPSGFVRELELLRMSILWLHYRRPGLAVSPLQAPSEGACDVISDDEQPPEGLDKDGRERWHKARRMRRYRRAKNLGPSTDPSTQASTRPSTAASTPPSTPSTQSPRPSSLSLSLGSAFESGENAKERERKAGSLQQTKSANEGKNGQIVDGGVDGPPKPEKWAVETRRVFDYWIVTLGKDPKRTKLTPQRAAKIKARLRDGFSAERLCRALDGVKLSQFHMGDNDSGKAYTGLTTILKSADVVDGHIERAEGQTYTAPAATRARQSADEAARQQAEDTRLRDAGAYLTPEEVRAMADSVARKRAMP